MADSPPGAETGSHREGRCGAATLQACCCLAVMYQLLLLETFSKLGKANVSLTNSVRPSSSNYSTATGRISRKFDI
jgi:hypothetical protein